MTADVNEIMNAIADSVGTTASTLSHDIRKTVEFLSSPGTSRLGTPPQESAEIAQECSEGEGVIDLVASTGGGGGGGGGSSLPGCFEISAGVRDQSGTGWTVAPGTLVNCHIICGGVCANVGGTFNAWDSANQNRIIALRLARDYAGGVTLQAYDDFAAIRSDQTANDVCVYPLYKIGTVTEDPTTHDKSGTVEIDFRNIPHFDTWSAYGGNAT